MRFVPDMSFMSEIIVRHPIYVKLCELVTFRKVASYSALPFAFPPYFRRVYKIEYSKIDSGQRGRGK